MVIRLDHVSRRFGHKLALDNVSLQIGQGDLFGVIGPDGSGKTTLLRLIAAVLDPTTADRLSWREQVLEKVHPPVGHIIVSGCDTVTQPETIKAHLGYMPQHFGLYDDLSVDENLTFTATVFGINGAVRRNRIAELLAFTGLEGFRSRRARLLSGGMKKKLALACAILHRPPLLLLDEPTTGVDPVTRRDFWELLSKLHAEGITIVVSTPYMDEAERCNRLVLLFQGRILTAGSPSEIKASVPGQVLSVQGTDFRAAAQALKSVEGIRDMQPYGDSLTLIVDGEISTVQRTARDLLKAQNVPFQDIQPIPIRMEEAFIYLTGEERHRIEGTQ
ncbi:MAG: ABC transporter ATP-binding protein [Chloroflexota bacterium]